MLVIDNLQTGYGAIEAVHGISLTVDAGQLVSVVGANGAGKTAMLLAAAGVLKHSGTVSFEGKDLSSQPAYLRARAGMLLVPEGRRIFAGLSVRDNLLSGSMHKAAKAVRAERLELVFETFPRLKERQSQAGDLMSGGEQQMLAIGRTLMGNPRLIMLDEPSLGLSPLMIQEVFAAIESLRRNGLTILLIEQNVEHSLEISDYSYVVDQGRVVLDGTGSDLIADPRVQQAFLSIGEDATDTSVLTSPDASGDEHS